MSGRSFAQDFKRTFITGLFVVGPFSLTFLLLAWIVSIIDAAVSPLLGFIGRPVHGLGLLVGFLVIWLAGLIANNIVGRHALGMIEDMLLKIPVFNWLYRTIKQVSEAFSPAGRAFRGVALVEYPRPSVYSIGFVTNEFALDRGKGEERMVSVYVPTNNMYIGDVVVVPASSVVLTELSQQQGVQAVISAGAALPPLIKGGERRADRGPSAA